MKSDPIELLIIIDYFHRTGGTEKHLYQLLAGLPATDFHVTVVIFDLGDNPLIDAMRARGVEIIHLPVGREYVPNALKQGWRLFRLVQRGRFDIIQTYHQKADTFGALIAWMAGARHLISSKRDTGELRNRLHVFLNRRLRGLFQAFIMAADEVGRAVVRRDGLVISRTRTIYNGVDTQYFSPPTPAERAQARNTLGISANDFVVGMVAGFRPEKNHEVFFEALRRLRAANVPVKGIAVGGGPLLDSYRRHGEDGELRGCLTFSGDVSDIRPYLRAMDVGCLTPGSNEGFSNALIEQMASGLPLVVSDIGGNAEAVADGVTGFVVPPRNAAALASSLRSLWIDPDRRRDFGLRARERATRDFSLQHMCEEHIRLYRELCRSGRT